MIFNSSYFKFKFKKNILSTTIEDKTQKLTEYRNFFKEK